MLERFGSQGNMLLTAYCAYRKEESDYLPDSWTADGTSEHYLKHASEPGLLEEPDVECLRCCKADAATQILHCIHSIPVLSCGHVQADIAIVSHLLCGQMIGGRIQSH